LEERGGKGAGSTGGGGDLTARQPQAQGVLRDCGCRLWVPCFVGADCGCRGCGCARAQVFFRFYRKLAGMTGTATAAAAEFYEMYGLKVSSGSCTSTGSGGGGHQW